MFSGYWYTGREPYFTSDLIQLRRTNGFEFKASPYRGFFFFFFIPKHVLIEEKKKNVWSQLCTRMEGLDNGGTGFCHSTKDACFRRTNLTWNSKLVETQKITNETWLEFSGWTMSNLTRLLAINFIFIYKNSNVVNIF